MRAPVVGQPGTALVRWLEGAPLVVLLGDLDMGSAGQLAAIGRLLRSWDTPRVALAEEVTFIDAAGLRAVLSLAAPGTPLALCRPSAAVVRLLGLLTSVEAGVRVSPGRGPAGTISVTGLPGW